MIEPDDKQPTRPPLPAVAWAWSGALLGALYAIPAAIVTLNDVSRGVAFAVGVIPAAAIGLAPKRRRRRAVAVVGGLVGVAILVGSILANVPVIAVVGIFALGIGATLLARRTGAAGRLVLTLGMPMVGVGLSYTEVATAAGLALVMIGGSLYACAVSLALPEHPAPPVPTRPVPPPTVEYGVLLGLTGATAAAIGFALGLDHVGWACAAALLVMRPSREMQEVRSVGRIASVIVGALVGSIVVDIGPPAWCYAAIVVVVVAAVAATRGSRWYITSAFTTFLVFVLLLYSSPASAGSRFGERVGETVLGVGLAYLFGLAVPTMLERRRTVMPEPPANH